MGQSPKLHTYSFTLGAMGMRVKRYNVNLGDRYVRKVDSERGVLDREIERIADILQHHQNDTILTINNA
jgi:hypothetical protein